MTAENGKDTEGQENKDIQIVITLTPTPSGYRLNVGGNRPDLFPETIIEACHRAASFYERMLLASTVIQQSEEREKFKKLQRSIPDIIKP